MKMRVGIINHHGRTPGGAEFNLLLQLDALPSDIEPHVFIFEEGAFADIVRARYKHVTLVPMSHAIAVSTRTRPHPLAFFHAPFFAIRLARHFKTASIDLVLTNSMKAHVVGSIAAKIAGLPCVNHIHDIPTGFARFVLRAISGLFATERIACSRSASDNLALSRTTVIYSALDLKKYRPLPLRNEARELLGLPNDGIPIVSLVGRIARWKGQDRFLRIAARVRERLDAHFLIVGSAVFGCDPQFVPELTETVSVQGSADRVHFIPWHDDLRNIYAASDLSCNCSTREPFGRTTIEAMACEVPIICFEDAGVCEIFVNGESGAKVPCGDEEKFAAAIVSFLQDPEHLAAAKIAAYREASRFDVSKTTADFRLILARAASRRKVRHLAESFAEPVT